MTETTADMLASIVDNNAETIAAFAAQIDAGEYGNRWTVTDTGAEDITDSVVIADTEDEALALAQNVIPGIVDADDLLAERDSFDEPTICDEHGNETAISDWPLEVVVKIGRALAVVIGTGGPHIEIVQDLGDGSAKLAGYWGGEKVYRHGSQYQTVLDYLTDSLYDEAPEEYK